MLFACDDATVRAYVLWWSFFSHIYINELFVLLMLDLMAQDVHMDIWLGQRCASGESNKLLLF